MQKRTKIRLSVISLMLFSNTAFAFNFQKYVNNLQSYLADETARLTLLGIIGSCGNASNLDDNCVVTGLERVATEENNTIAKSILSDYNQALLEGQGNKPECQTESHKQVNRIIGHCVLLLNYYAIDSNDKDAAQIQYETCLQGGMMGLAYQGNLAAQYMLSDIFIEKGQSDPGMLWRNSLETRKDSDEYKLLMSCYR